MFELWSFGYNGMSVSTTSLFALVLAIAAKHIAADYFIPVGKQRYNKQKWQLAMLEHSAIHGVLMFSILMFWIPMHWALFIGLADLVVHAILDTSKRYYSVLLNAKNVFSRRYWWVHGFDQYLHFLSYVVFFYCAVAVL